MFPGVIWCLWIVSWFVYLAADNPIVETTYGPVKGFTFKTTNGKTANIFLGIPFAKPPVGELRFEKPVKPDKWTEVMDGTNLKTPCYPFSETTGIYSEDCLHLNIMAPAAKGTYPVIVWIHGGGYNYGSAVYYGYETIANNFVSRDVIYVTIQYRLSAFGFFSTGDSIMPGNYGLWDQTMALQFIRDNIAYFGGDPERIIIQGLSAGGASTSALSLSPHSRDLFSGSIQMSGSAFAEWSFSGDVPKESLQLAEIMGCKSDDHQMIKKCLQAKSAQSIMEGTDKMSFRGGFKIAQLTVRNDGDFFPKDLKTLIKEGPKKPAIIGLAEKEGILFLLRSGLKTLGSLSMQPDEIRNYTRGKLVEFIKKFGGNSDYGDQANKAAERMISFYANANDADEADHKYWIHQYIKFVDDVMFITPVLLETEVRLKNDWPIWFYVTDYYHTPTKSTELIEGAMHAGEEAHLFGMFYLDKFDYNSDDIRHRDNMLDAFTNFAKNGVPTMPNVDWKPLTKDYPRRNLRLRPKPIMLDGAFEERREFWRSMDHFNYNIITGERKTTGESKQEL